MNSKILLGIIIVALVGGGLYMASKSSTPSVPADQTAPQEETAVMEKTDTSGVSAPSGASTDTVMAKKGAVQSFTVDGNNFSFSLKEIKVKKGDTVEIVFNNKEGFHDWVVDEFNAKTNQIKAGESETIQFVADKTGTFEYYCSVGQHRANGMKGNLIVE